MATATPLKTFLRIGVLGAATLACATTGQDIARDQASTLRPSPAAVVLDPSVASPSRPNSDALTAAELAAAPNLAYATAYDVLMRLRPAFLTPRDPRAGAVAARRALPAVFVDGADYGGLEVLRGIAASAVVDMQYVRSLDAMHRYGPDYGAGVILVRLRR
jgi:hypothetical protein